MKVFGIGMNKTGTTTLGECLRTLGYRHTSYDLELLRCLHCGDLEPIFAVTDQFDSFEDWPWPLIYKELDERYPGSRFILTTRKSTSVWMRSLLKHAERTGPTEMREIVYGHAMPRGNEAAHTEKYESHNAAVREYFRDRPLQFLEICWENGDGWTELCRILDKPIPDMPLPHANRSPERGVKKFIKQVGAKLRRGPH